MKIYFSAAILYKKNKEDTYRKIISILKKNNYQVLSYGVLDKEIDVILKQTDKQRIEFYNSVIKWINECDLMITEASFPSTIHIGHEISLAIEKNKPVIALHEKGKEPFFLKGINTDKLFLVEYDLDNLEREIKQGIDYAKDQMDTRFNFFISPKIGNYLDWIAKKKKTPRAVYLRKLIEENMEENQDYKG